MKAGGSQLSAQSYGGMYQQRVTVVFERTACVRRRGRKNVGGR